MNISTLSKARDKNCTNNIFFLDLKIPYDESQEQIDAAYKRVMESGWYILGKEVPSFESAFG